jgi:hypothetical protein
MGGECGMEQTSRILSRRNSMDASDVVIALGGGPSLMPGTCG